MSSSLAGHVDKHLRKHLKVQPAPTPDVLRRLTEALASHATLTGGSNPEVARVLAEVSTVEHAIAEHSRILNGLTHHVSNAQDEFDGHLTAFEAYTKVVKEQLASATPDLTTVESLLANLSAELEGLKLRLEKIEKVV